MRGLKGKTAIITGGTKGIGRATAERLLEEGVKVLLIGRGRNDGEKSLAELKEKHADVAFFQADMKAPDAPARVVAEGMRLYGNIDYIVNNAFPFNGGAETATREDWLNTFEGGTIAYARLTAEWVKAHGRDKPGAVVMTSSISDTVAQAMRWPYNTAKGAVKELIRCAALDLAPNIRVNGVSPGWTKTDAIRQATPGKSWESTPTAWKDFHMLRRMIEPEEVANAIAFLLSDEASGITAHTLYVDGGYTAMGPEGLGKDSQLNL